MVNLVFFFVSFSLIFCIGGGENTVTGSNTGVMEHAACIDIIARGLTGTAGIRDSAVFPVL